MKKPRQEDPLIAEIQQELRPGRFIRSEDVSQLTGNLGDLGEKIGALVKTGEAERAVRLYEILLSGVYAKVEEADDECYLAMVFHRLACGWIQARQAAGRPAEETLNELLAWKKNDQYGFCYEIEKIVIKVLDARGQQLLIGHFQERVDQALPAPTAGPARAIFEYENNLRLPALTLKEIYESLSDARSYAALCDRLGLIARPAHRQCGEEQVLQRSARSS